MNKKKAFTLVETIVVVAVMGLVLPTLFSILFLIMRQQVKIYRLAEVKRQGDYIISTLENTIRNNAYKIYNGVDEVCGSASSSSPTVTSFRDKFGSSFSFSLTGSNLTSSSTVTSPAPTFAFSTGQLNNSKVGISAPFTLTCSRGPTLYSGPIVNVSFTICFLSGASCAAGADQASLNYQTSIKLRNFPTE